MNKHSSRSHCVFTLVVSSQAPTPDGGVMECKGVALEVPHPTLTHTRTHTRTRTIPPPAPPAAIL
eukprot:5271154-Pleurochrysis_carterae.AAC.1